MGFHGVSIARGVSRFDRREVGGLPSEKAYVYSLAFLGTEDFLNEQVLPSVRRDWPPGGEPLYGLLTFKQRLSAFRGLLSESFG